jgi:Lon protease-like protein
VPPLLPIFPLELVLLPGTSLPLHIFEPRYREMIGECLEAKKPFGVVRAKDNEGMAAIGCTAEIVKLVKRYEDGRMDILTIGRRRFEITEVHRERNFLQAEVMFLDDEELETGNRLQGTGIREQKTGLGGKEPGGSGSPDVSNEPLPGAYARKRKRALALFEEISSALGETGEIDKDAALISYQLAGALSLDLDFKQALLGVRSEAERLSGLVDFFEAILPKLKKAARRREKAGGNGHVL